MTNPTENTMTNPKTNDVAPTNTELAELTITEHALKGLEAELVRAMRKDMDYMGRGVDGYSERISRLEANGSTAGLARAMKKLVEKGICRRDSPSYQRSRIRYGFATEASRQEETKVDQARAQRDQLKEDASDLGFTIGAHVSSTDQTCRVSMTGDEFARLLARVRAAKVHGL